MLSFLSVGISAIGAVAAVVGAIYAWRTYRSRFKHLPKIELYGDKGDFWVHAATDHSSIGWRVIRVEVDEAEPKACLERRRKTYLDENHMEYGLTGEWHESLDYSDIINPLERDKLPLIINPHCYTALLTFVFELPSAQRLWWQPWRRKPKVERVPYKYLKGDQLSLKQHPWYKSD